MRRWLFCLLVLCAQFVQRSPAAAACLDPDTLVPAVASITREFNEQGPAARSGVVGFRGTGWFVSPRLMVTAAHVVEAMQLSSSEWTAIEIREREHTAAAAVRIVRVLGSHAEKLAVLELEAPFPGATALQIRTQPLVPDEPVVAVAYPGGRLRTAGGRFVQWGADDKTAGAALFEMYDGEDRMVLDHGASGAPVLDCAGRVVAVVTNTFSQTLRFQSQVIRISTPWHSANVASVPVAGIEELLEPE